MQCQLLDYEGSRLYDEYPDRFMLYHICSLVKDEMTKDASAQEMPGGFLDDLIQVLVYQEISGEDADAGDVDSIFRDNSNDRI